ncbi:uncharacterized protein LOC116206277 [Punica granatum]|uniref:Uncharacterized protein n=2 Tax=Punica granatum TaxID=22663 RepID=A0A218XTX9_PUNGR|nr:uncharacterized protein LOC116206277 [Punica granatum]OWM88404.1 hypothetical protein CDL15_Pgr003816 [Punica granatum]PKI49487.1 hypothetical protein CRG98_030104 [Punica granatum]
MRLTWSPERASKAYIETVTACKAYQESGVPELVSAMAAGWNSQLILETWARGRPIATSIGLAVSSSHTGGRHVCVVPDEQSRLEYVTIVGEVASATEVIVGEAEEAMQRMAGIDFMVVDCRQEDFGMLLRTARLGSRGAVLVCKNASSRVGSGFRWRSILDGGAPRRLVRSVFLPVGKGLDIAYVGTSGGGTSGSARKNSRWIKHIDRESGEEIIIRK